MKKQKLLKRIVTMVLCLVLAVNGIRLDVFATNLPETETAETVAESELPEETEKEVYIVSEVVEKREQNAKHFRMSDGSVMVAVYPYDVHYTDENGEWKDIDNSLVSDTDESDSVYGNRKNETFVKFMKKSNKNKLFTFTKDGYKIKVAIDDVSKVKGSVSESTVNSEKGNPYELKNLGGQITYTDILENTDIQYTVVSKELKENIILKKQVDFQSITYRYQLDNRLEAVQQDEQTVILQKKGSGEIFMEITAPVMWDSAGQYDDGLKLILTESKNGKVTIKLSWDMDWLANATYPVTVDPVMSFSTNRLEIQDTHILADYPTTNYDVNNHVRVRNNGYAMVRFPTPALSVGDKIIHAELLLYPYGNFDNSLSIYTNENSYDPPLYINAHKILRSWDETTATYQNVNPDSGFYDSTVQSHRIVDGDDSFYTWDITRLANEWTEGYSANYGVLLKYDQPPSDGSIFDSFFCSTNGAYIDSSAWPQILY